MPSTPRAPTAFRSTPSILGHKRIVQQAQGGGSRQPPNLRSGRQAMWGANAPPGAGGGTQVQRNQQNQRLNRARDQEALMATFAAVGEATGGQAFDPPQVSNKALRKVFQGIAEQVAAEYLVGYYPDAVDDEKTPHQVEVRLSEAVRGKLYGGSRVIVH